MSETTPDRLVAALTAAGWTESYRVRDSFVRMSFRLDSARPVVLAVPLNPADPRYGHQMGVALRRLEYLAAVGTAANRALTEATCSCGGKRWVEDEGWQPEEWAMAVKPVREPGAGLIPCGRCNHGGWNVPVGGSAA